MTGLETAIILVAFVITAAAFAFVILNMGFLTAQKAQSVISSGMAEASSAMLTDSGIIAEFDNTGEDQADIDLVKLTFYLRLSQGHEPIDLDDSKLLGTYTNARCHAVIYPSPNDPEKGESTFTKTVAAGTITVTAPTDSADFTAGLYDATGTSELVPPAPSTEGDTIPDTVTLTYTYEVGTTYMVKITQASESGEYVLTDEIPGVVGSVTVPTGVMVVSQVNGDSDSLLEVGEKFRVTIDFSLLPAASVDPDQSATPDGIYVHPYEELRIELRPSTGAVLAIEKHIPAVYSTIMVID